MSSYMSNFSPDIGNLPPEILCRILSFLQQREIFETIGSVCSTWHKISFTPALWRNVNFQKTYHKKTSSHSSLFSKPTTDYIGSKIKCFIHFRKLTNAIQQLEIHSDDLEELLSFDQSIDFKKLTFLTLRDYGKQANCLNKIVKKSKNLREISYIDMLDHYSKDIQGLFGAFSGICGLETLLLGGDFGDKFENSLLNVISNSHSTLKKFSYRSTFSTISDNTISMILERCKGLSDLDICCNSWAGVSLQNSTVPLNLKKIRILSEKIDVSGLKNLVQRCQELKSIEMKSLFSRQHGVKYLADSCHFLTEIKTQSDLSNADLKKIASGCPDLEIFEAGIKFGLDSGIVYLAKKCYKLKELKLTHGRSLTDMALIALGNYEFLEKASFHAWKNITLAGIEYVIRRCKFLTLLSVFLSESVGTGLPFSEFLDQLPCNKNRVIYKIEDPVHSHLRELDLNFCQNVSNSTVIRLAKICPDLRTLRLLTTNVVIDEEFRRTLNEICIFQPEIEK